MNSDGHLIKLIRLCNSISSDQKILSDLISEIEDPSSDEILCKMIKKFLKNTDLDSIGLAKAMLPICFEPLTITELDLFKNKNLGITCFFMSKGTHFPIHNHPNESVATSVLFGQIRYLVLKKIDDEKMKFCKKGTGKPGDVLFNTKNYQNIHAVFAEQDSVILDIFMHNLDDPGVFFKVLKYCKREKIFHVVENRHVSFLTRSWKIINYDDLKI